MKKLTTSAFINAQKGAVLIVGLVLLLIMTLIGVSATTVTVFDEKLGSSLRDKDTSIQAAEAALSAGESWLKTNQHNKAQLAQARSSVGELVAGTVACTNNTQPLWDNANSVMLSNSEYDASHSGAESALIEQPRFTRELVGREKISNLGSSGYGQVSYMDTYRFTSRGAGRAANSLGTARSVTVLQSHYSIPSQP